MGSKSGMPPSSSYDDDPSPPPPSYIESLSTTHKPIPSYGPSSTITSQYYSSQIQHQLQDLTTTITSLQTQKSLLSHAHDEKILSLLTHQIQIYLTEFAKSGLQRGTLILVPKKGLEDENALPAQYDFKDPEEYDRVVRVSDKESGDRARNEFGGYGDEDDGAEMWYWRDEDMARRLAGYLRPVRDPRTLELPPRKEQVQAQLQQAEASSSSSRGFWGRKKSSVKKDERPPLIEEPRSDEKVEPVKKDEDRVVMEVNAEEVVFRTENDFGIFETKRGWGIVLKLKVVLGGR